MGNCETCKGFGEMIEAFGDDDLIYVECKTCGGDGMTEKERDAKK